MDLKKLLEDPLDEPSWQSTHRALMDITPDTYREGLLLEELLRLRVAYRDLMYSRNESLKAQGELLVSLSQATDAAITHIQLSSSLGDVIHTLVGADE